jgi:hypothetical protein
MEKEPYWTILVVKSTRMGRGQDLRTLVVENMAEAPRLHHQGFEG